MTAPAPVIDESGLIDLATNPPVVPPWVRQFSVVLERDEGPSSELPLFQDIPLPAELKDAVARRRLQFLGGRFCALQALRRLDPTGGADLKVGPYIPRGEQGAPIWPAGVVGSITHTDGFISAAVASACEARSIGIDSERIVSRDRAKRVVMYVSWPCELVLGRHAGLDALQSLTLVFSAKESIFKCLNPLVGIMFHYDDVRITAIDGAAGIFRARLGKTLSPAFVTDTCVEGRFSLSGSLVHTGVCLTAA